MFQKIDVLKIQLAQTTDHIFQRSPSTNASTSARCGRHSEPQFLLTLTVIVAPSLARSKGLPPPQKTTSEYWNGVLKLFSNLSLRLPLAAAATAVAHPLSAGPALSPPALKARVSNIQIMT